MNGQDTSTTHTASKPGRIGLALSGGGYRATAFHLGTLKKLHQLEILNHVDVISTISGGSITGACYCCEEIPFEKFHEQLYNGLQQKNVIKKTLLSWLGLRMMFVALLFLASFVLLFTNYPWLFPIAIIILVIILLKFQFAILPISTRIEQVYDQFFFRNKKLSELKVKPELVIGATNIQTARSFIFTRTWMQDSTYQFMDEPIEFIAKYFPISRAVMASSCVPFAFTPVKIDKEFFEDQNEAEIIHPLLVDGGVYDNQGIHRVMQAGRYECSSVITSDAGAGSTGELSFKNTFALLLETVNVFMSRIKKAQMVRNVYDNASTANKEIAYFSLGWDVENCIDGFIKNLSKKQITAHVIKAHALKSEWVEQPKLFANEIKTYLSKRLGFDSINKPTAEEKKIARKVGTNLTSLSKLQVDCLMKQAEALTELQVKLYCPSLIQ